MKRHAKIEYELLQQKIRLPLNEIGILKSQQKKKSQTAPENFDFVFNAVFRKTVERL